MKLDQNYTYNELRNPRIGLYIDSKEEQEKKAIREKKKKLRCYYMVEERNKI